MTIDKNELQLIIDNSKTYGDVLRHFGLENKGGNHNTLKRRIKNDNLSTDNIIKFKSGGGWNKGLHGFDIKALSKEEVLNIVFIKNYTGGIRPRTYIRRYNLIEEKCNECGLTNIWNNKLITLELDHIDGDSHNNLLTNLRWVCPNCHSQTDTFRGRNRKIEHFCECGKLRCKSSNKCVDCNHKEQLNKNHKIIWPSDTELMEMMKTTSLYKLSKTLGVTSNSIRKHCYKRNINWRKDGAMGGI